MIPKDAKLTGRHLFYKNDQPEGFGVGLVEEYFIDNTEAEKLFTDASQMSINEYKKLHTDKDRARGLITTTPSHPVQLPEPTAPLACTRVRGKDGSVR